MRRATQPGLFGSISIALRGARALRSAGAAVAMVALVLLAATPAAATERTLLRGFTNVAFGPLDAALAPVSTFVGIRDNMASIDDSPGVRLVYPIPGFFYTLGIQVAGAGIRSITGGLEMLAGVLVLFSDTDVDPLFATIGDAAALVEFESDILDDGYRFGVNYSTPGF